MSVLRKYNIQQGIKRPKLYVYISDNQIHITSNLPGTLKIVLGQDLCLMLVSIQQTFSTGKIEYMQMPTA